MNLQKPAELIHTMITEHESFPGNPRLPLLIYKQAFTTPSATEDISSCLEQHDWGGILAR